MSSSASHRTTTPGKSPAFQFYPGDFISGTVDLSAEDVGVYLRLLCHQWSKGRIPADLQAQARIGGVALSRMRSIWTRIARHFVTSDNFTYQNPRLEKERNKQAEYRRRQSDKGKASAASRNASRGSTVVQPAHQPDRQPRPNSSVFGLQSSDLSHKDITRDPVQRLVDRHEELHRQYQGVGYIGNPMKDYQAACALVKTFPDVSMQDAILIYGLNDADDFMASGTRTLAKITSRASDYAQLLKAKALA